MIPHILLISPIHIFSLYSLLAAQIPYQVCKNLPLPHPLKTWGIPPSPPPQDMGDTPPSSLTPSSRLAGCPSHLPHPSSRHGDTPPSLTPSSRHGDAPPLLPLAPSRYGGEPHSHPFSPSSSQHGKCSLTNKDWTFGPGSRAFPHHHVVCVIYLTRGRLCSPISSSCSSPQHCISPAPGQWRYSGGMSDVLVANYLSGGCMLPELGVVGVLAQGWVSGKWDSYIFIEVGWIKSHVSYLWHHHLWFFYFKGWIRRYLKI